MAAGLIVVTATFVPCPMAARWDPSTPKARWQMKWIDPQLKAGDKRSALAADLETAGCAPSFEDIPEDVQAALRPAMPVIYKDADFLVMHKPYDVRMDGEHAVTCESLALEWLASIGTPAASCHAVGWKKAPPTAAPEGGEAAEADADEGDAARPAAPVYVHNAGLRSGTRGVVAPQLRFVHRLDYATSGVLLMALNRKACGAAGALFEGRKAAKQYLAICYGHIPKEGISINQPIAPFQVAAGEETMCPTGSEGSKDFRMCIGSVENPGKDAQTEVKVIAHGSFMGKPVTKVLLLPRTGRRHQLRVHMAYVGNPIVGDFTYCGDSEAPRIMLHAWTLDLPLPAKWGGARTFVAEDPFGEFLRVGAEDFVSIWEPAVPTTSVPPAAAPPREHEQSEGQGEQGGTRPRLVCEWCLKHRGKTFNSHTSETCRGRLKAEAALRAREGESAAGNS